MRLECRSRTAISCDSRERREQHFRRPAEKADRFWSAPRLRTRRPEAVVVPSRQTLFLGSAQERRSVLLATGRRGAEVLPQVSEGSRNAISVWSVDLARG